MKTEREFKTVVIADETPYSREMLSFLITEAGHEVHVAENGEQARILLEEHGAKLDLVILDLEPGADGELDLPSPLAPEGTAASVPLLVVTGAASGPPPSNDRIDAILQRTVSTERILFAINSLLYPQDDATRDTGRQLVRFPVSFRPKEPVFAEAFNMSGGGIFLVVEDATLPPIGTALCVLLDLPGGESQEIVGVVMWRNTGPQLERSHPRGIGVRFLEPQPQLQQFLSWRGASSKS
jgi:CheY-like chemotaxis protein